MIEFSPPKRYLVKTSDKLKQYSLLERFYSKRVFETYMFKRQTANLLLNLDTVHLVGRVGTIKSPIYPAPYLNY